MFWDIYSDLCKRNNTSPNGVAAALGLSNATCTKWKHGATPGGNNLKKIADYFGVTTGYLLGESAQAPAAEDPLTDEIISYAKILSRTEKGIKQLEAVASTLKRIAELEQLTAELEAKRPEQK